jgi:hypothetical protein
MDGDEQIAPQTVGARHTLKQTAQPRPARDQSDCFVEACLMQRLCDDVGKLNSYSVTPRALSAPGEVAVWPTSMSTRNADRAQLPLSLPCCVTGSSARASCPVVPVSITASATSRRKLPLLTIIDHNCTGAAASQPNRGFLGSPHALCTCLLAVVQTI